MKIYSVKENISFDTLSLGNPARLQGGSYYSKLFLNNDSVFLKIEYCATKQGVVETNNKTYTDLLFTVNESEYVDWFSDLETKVKEILTTKANDWFTQNLSDDDIEHFYNSCVKTYKTNQTLLRTFIDTNSGNQKCSIFDENKMICDMASVENRKIATILHIKGIRLTSTSFQLDIENKQILLLEDRNVFEECMLDVNKSVSKPTIEENKVLKENVPLKAEATSTDENLGSLEQSKEVKHSEQEKSQDTDNESEYDSEDLKEIDLNHFVNENDDNDQDENINKTNQKMKLKTPQDVYLEMYQLAKKRAKETRKQAIKAYIDAQNIKAAYLIKDDDAQQTEQYPYNDISDDSESSDSDSESDEYEGDDDEEQELGKRN